MDSQALTYFAVGLAAAAGTAAVLKVGRRLQLSRAKHPSLTGHPRWARRIAGLVPFYEFGEEQFFASDAAPSDIAARRRSGFEALARHYRDEIGRAHV